MATQYSMPQTQNYPSAPLSNARDEGLMLSHGDNMYDKTTNGNMKRTHKLSSRHLNDPASITKLQKLLLLLRHASKCPLEGKSSLGNGPVCHVSHCSSMKKLWHHIGRCCKSGSNPDGEDNRGCNFPHCARSRFALWHYKHCDDGDACPVCGPVRNAISNEKDKRPAPVSSLDQAQSRTNKRRRMEQTTPVQTRRDDTARMTDETRVFCNKLLQDLLQHRNGWVFSSPVDPVLLNIPDYFDVIKKPMDLGTIEEHLSTPGTYTCAKDFKDEVLLTFDNAIQYNKEGSEVFVMAVEMKDFFQPAYKAIFG